MTRLNILKSMLIGGASVTLLASAATAAQFNIPAGDLATALDAYTVQTGVSLLIGADSVRAARTNGAKGELTAEVALARILAGTGFVVNRESGAIAVVPAPTQRAQTEIQPLRLAQAASSTAAGIESVVVTSSKIKGDIQTVPIAITALSQEQLTSRQIAGGPDLVKEVPNLTFSKTNFTGYNIQIRGIGTQAISVTTDPAVAVAFNDMPFLRNHFFEQEFYDVSQVEVLRGPQGTLYGRNATAGVVNVISATPTDQFEAMLSADFGNYHNRRYEGMVNIPIVDDRLDLRVAAEWTKRDGYTTDTTYNAPIDGRDLWSSRVTVGWKPASDVQTYLVWEHFQESDDRLRSGKQICKTDYGPGFVATDLSNPYPGIDYINGGTMALGPSAYSQEPPGGDQYVQGCLPNVSLYSPQAFGAPLGYALPYALGAEDLGIANPLNPYASVTQSTNLRDIESSILPTYRAKNDTLEFNANWNVTPALTFTSQTGYNNDFLWSTEDFNRFGSTPGFFALPQYATGGIGPDPSGLSICSNIFQSDCGAGVPIGSPCPNGSSGGGCAPAAYICDPQLGCSDRLIVEDLSTERAWQFSQEFRLASNFSGPLNFTAGGNFLHYETFEKYYVFSNVLTYISANPNVESCITCAPHLNYGYRYNPLGLTNNPTGGYIDPNPLSSLNDEGHNYYLNNNPYVLNSYALFGEANYNLTNDLKFTGGLRWTDDQKHFLEMPSWVATYGYGYPVSGVLNQGWERFTGRAVANWTPQLDFTDQTLVYASYAHGYKAGGANPPRAQFTTGTDFVHPLTFKPEYIEAFELGSKNTLLDGALTLNGDVFYYNYTGYQISEIVDRTAINTNFNAHVEGAELESKWEPAPGLSFNLAAGYESTTLNKGEAAVDLMDRTAGHPGWYVFKPYVTEASNCVFPGYVAQHLSTGGSGGGPTTPGYCSWAYIDGLDPVTNRPYVPYPFGPGVYAGFDPFAGRPGDPYTGQNTGDLCVQNCDGTGTPVYTTFDFGPVPNNGAGFAKNLGGKQLPNAPHFTVSLAGQYTMPVSTDWAATFHTDFYWQSQSWARVFDDPIDKIHGYVNVNLSLILTSADGWQVMGYVKNVFDKTAITGTFLNSDDTGLTTNIFLTDPRLFGVRVTKNFDGSGLPGGGDLFSNSDADDKKPQMWLTLGGGFDQLSDGEQTFAPPFYSMFTAPLSSPAPFQHPPRGSFDYDASLVYQPEDSDWMVSASIRYGRTARQDHTHESNSLGKLYVPIFGNEVPVTPPNASYFDAFDSSSESHEIVDFAVGKEVGLGMFGLHGSSELSGGVRFVQFNQASNASIHGDPKFVFHTLGPKYHYNDSAIERANSRFHGIGPSLSWNASAPVTDSGDAGSINLDWGVNAALLFGRQVARVHHQTNGAYACFPVLNGNSNCHHGSYGKYDGHYVNGYDGVPAYMTHYQHSGPARGARSRSVMVPNLGGFAGISWRYSNAKISFGYRADEFFGAMDGGLDSRKSYNLGLFGPYANLSLGFGG